MIRKQIDRRTMIASSSLALGAAWTFPSRSTHAAQANDEIRLGFISCGGRAGGLMSEFKQIEGVRITGLCDPDEERVASKAAQFPEAKTFTDLRQLIDDENIDAVVIATCNHWHCLAAIWAMEAGKDVYVEKPLSHSQWEGDQTVAAARNYKRICQVGTQQRSDPMQADIKKFLHQEKGLGKILACRVNRFGVRAPIGKRATPLPINKGVAYDLWLGPAQDRPIFRDKLHYDWHWDFNTGSGEMGNWGVHVLDDARNNVFLDKVKLPSRVMGGGGRVAWNDAGDTPNVHFCYFDTGEIPTIIGLSNMTAGPGQRNSPSHPGPGSGYIAYCEGGRFEGQRGRGRAVDNDGKEIKSFRGTSGMGIHQQNFIDAVRSRDASTLNTDVEVGNDSTGWCNLANIAFQAGRNYSHNEAAALSKDVPKWGELIGEMSKHLSAHNIDIAGGEVRLSPMMDYSNTQRKFVGDNADKANSFLKREYRAPYVVPELTGKLS
ncbi:MAG: Gfo/Idh/MocA family oxidoreductase [Planctomycetales bacterium]|nr:Gfo/Idh/MocA family oxidoreductase [Planctomycetales bacterium]